MDDEFESEYVSHPINVGLPMQMAGSDESYDEMINSLATDVLNEARTTLMMSFRFLDTALWKMPQVMDWHPLALATDCRSLYVNPLFTLARFQEGFSEVVRDYLHTVLHCIFRHPLDEEHINTGAWSLACDIMVESLALEMTEGRFTCEDDVRRAEEIETIKQQMGRLSPTKLYRIFAAAEINGPLALENGYNAARVWDLRQLFQRDGHDMWANKQHQKEGDNKADQDAIRKRNLSDRLQDKMDDEPEKAQDMNTCDPDQEPQEEQGESAEESQEQSSLSQEQQQAEAQETQETQGTAHQGEESQESTQQGEGESQSQTEESEEGTVSQQSQAQGQGSSSLDQDQLDALEEQLRQEIEEHRQEWEEIAKQIEMDLQSFSQGKAGNAGGLSQSLAVANRRLANYNDFLRQFATMGEDMKINDDEFDYIYYTFGLNTYGNMPLVEPLEYQESYRVREFVIALDTSGSCSGDLIKKFVTRTYDILRETEGFGDKVNIHLIQCDDRIRADLKVENVEDLEKYCDRFQAFGFGGTDFRPVFTYVEELQDRGEFENLRGLIYFTDGQGTFPKDPPGFETAFVFMDDGGSSISVPPWAMRVVMDEDQIINL